MIEDIFLVAVSDGIAQGADDSSRVPTGGRHQATDCWPKSQVSLLLQCCPVLKVLYFCYLNIIHWEVLCFTTTHPAQPSTHVSISLIIYMCICQQSFERSHVFWTSPPTPTPCQYVFNRNLTHIYVYLLAELWKIPRHWTWSLVSTWRIAVMMACLSTTAVASSRCTRKWGHRPKAECKCSCKFFFFYTSVKGEQK